MTVAYGNIALDQACNEMLFVLIRLLELELATIFMIPQGQGHGA